MEDELNKIFLLISAFSIVVATAFSEQSLAEVEAVDDKIDPKDVVYTIKNKNFTFRCVSDLHRVKSLEVFGVYQEGNRATAYVRVTFGKPVGKRLSRNCNDRKENFTLSLVRFSDKRWFFVHNFVYLIRQP